MKINYFHEAPVTTPGGEAIRGFEDLSEQELVEDWVNVALHDELLDEYVASPDTQQLVKDARRDYGLETGFSEEAYDAYINEVLRPAYASDPNVQAKNRMLAGIRAEPYRDTLHNPVVGMVASFRQAAGDPEMVHEDVIATNVRQQFVALWSVKELAT